MQTQPSDYLLDILEYIAQADEIIGQGSFEEFIGSKEKKLAIRKIIEIVGEAANRVPADLRAEYDDIEWVKIINTRHRLVHDYRNVNYNIVWAVAKTELPVLAERLSVILREMGIQP